MIHLHTSLRSCHCHQRAQSKPRGLSLFSCILLSRPIPHLISPLDTLVYFHPSRIMVPQTHPVLEVSIRSTEQSGTTLLSPSVSAGPGAPQGTVGPMGCLGKKGDEQGNSWVHFVCVFIDFSFQLYMLCLCLGAEDAECSWSGRNQRA